MRKRAGERAERPPQTACPRPAFKYNGTWESPDSDGNGDVISLGCLFRTSRGPLRWFRQGCRRHRLQKMTRFFLPAPRYGHMREGSPPKSAFVQTVYRLITVLSHARWIISEANARRAPSTKSCSSILLALAQGVQTRMGTSLACR